MAVVLGKGRQSFGSGRIRALNLFSTFSHPEAWLWAVLKDFFSSVTSRNLYNPASSQPAHPSFLPSALRALVLFSAYSLWMTVEFFSLPRMSISRVRKELLPALYMFKSILVPDILTMVSGPEPLHTRRKSLSMMELSSLRRQRWGDRGRELMTRTKVLGEGRLDLRNRANFYLLKLGQQIAKFVSNFFSLRSVLIQR